MSILLGCMEIIDIFRLIVWIVLLFWGGWNANVQLERFNKDVFNKFKAEVSYKDKNSKGLLRIVGIVIYSPYLMPVRATLLWVACLIGSLVLRER